MIELVLPGNLCFTVPAVGTERSQNEVDRTLSILRGGTLPLGFPRPQSPHKQIFFSKKNYCIDSSVVPSCWNFILIRDRITISRYLTNTQRLWMVNLDGQTDIPTELHCALYHCGDAQCRSSKSRQTNATKCIISPALRLVKKNGALFNCSFKDEAIDNNVSI